MIDAKLYDEAMREVAEMLTDAESLRDQLPESVRALPGWEENCRFIGGWVRHIEYLFDATVALIMNEQEHAAAPLVRLMLEDAVSAALVARDPEAWTAVLEQARKSGNRTLRAMHDAGVTPPGELEEFVNSLPPAVPDGYGSFSQMTGRFRALGGDGDRLLVSWGLLTQLSHGNAHSSTLFLDFTGGPGGIPSVRMKPQVPADVLNMYLVALDCLLLAAESLSQILVGDPLREEVLAIHERKAELEDRLIEASGD